MKENLIQWITKAVKQRLSKRNTDDDEVDSTIGQNGNENAGIFAFIDSIMI